MTTLTGKDADRFLKKMIKKEKSKPTKKEIELAKEIKKLSFDSPKGQTFMKGNHQKDKKDKDKLESHERSATINYPSSSDIPNLYIDKLLLQERNSLLDEIEKMIDDYWFSNDTNLKFNDGWLTLNEFKIKKDLKQQLKELREKR